MDLMSLLNSEPHLDLKSGGGILRGLLEQNRVPSDCTDSLDSIDQKTKYGRVLILANGEYTVACNACNGRFDTVESLSDHLKTVHWDYYARRNGWIKTTNRKEPIGKRDNVKYQECIPTDISARGTSEHPVSKESFTNVRQNVVTKANPKVSKKPTVVITAEPKYDEKRLFCITCDRQLTSRRNFTRHKYYHKECFRKHGAHLNCDNQEDVSTEIAIKDELDFGDYEIQDSAYNEGSVETSDNDDNTERGQTDSNDSLNPLSRNHDHLSKNSCSADVMREPTNATNVKLEAVDPDEEMELREDSIPTNRFPPKGIFNCHELRDNRKIRVNYSAIDKLRFSPEKEVKFVFSENPKFDDENHFCITCNRGFASKGSLGRHKGLHTKQIIERQGSLPKDTIRCNDDDVEHVNGDANSSLDSHYFSENSSQTSYEKTQSKTSTITDTHKGEELTDGRTVGIELTSPDRSNDNNEQYRTKDADQKLKPNSGNPIVFTLEPQFNEENKFCITCNLQLDSKKAFKVHKHGHNAKIRIWKIANGILPKAAISCELCSNLFRSEAGLRKHVVKHHGDEIPPSLRDDPTYLQCRFCFKEFEKPTERYEHEKSHGREEKRYQCSLCPKSFVNHFKRTIHESLHRENRWKPKVQVKMVFSESPKFDDKKGICITCNHKFTSRQNYNVHKRRHRILIREKQGIVQKIATYCELCSREFKTEDGLRRHVVPNHGDKIPMFLKNDPTYLQCKFCFKQFEKPTERYLHEKNHPKVEMPYQCRLCPQLFRKLCNRKHHELSHKANEKQPGEQPSFVFSENPKFDDEKCFCITCNRQFVSRARLHRHKRTHKMKIRLKQDTLPPKVITDCEFCSRHYKTEDGLRRHLVTDHGDNIPSAFKDDPTYLQCKFCFKEFEKPTDRHRHEESHPRKERSYKCPYCPQFFMTLYNRKTHEVTHKGGGRKPAEKVVYSDNPEFDGKNCFCITCNREFTSKISFNNHKRKHRIEIGTRQGTLPKATLPKALFRCEFCSKTFKSNIGLREHILPNHGDAIPTFLKDDPTYLMCRFCHKQFEKPTERYSHEKIHENEEKPFKCSTCSRVFSRNTERKEHETIHSQDRPFPCPHCLYSAKIRARLNRHILRVHSGKKSTRCKSPGNSQSHELRANSEEERFETNTSIGVNEELSSQLNTTRKAASVQLEEATNDETSFSEDISNNKYFF